MIAALIILVIVAGLAVWQQDRMYRGIVQSLQADNKDLRDRFFAKNQLPPSGVNLTQVYEERKAESQNPRENGKKQFGPVERWTQEMTAKDLKEAEQSRR